MPRDFALLDQCRAGDQSAWRELYDLHFDFVLRTSRHLGTPPGELDDVVQETFLVAFRRLSSFTTGRFTTWLYRIVANLVSSRLRRRRVREALLSLFGRSESDRVAHGPDHAFQSREAQDEVSAVLSRMAPKKREVFALYELEGLSGDEIAERVGCKVDTVWTRLHYARADFERLARQRSVIS
jgi:RNA polymerase sigma-70 factor (ECF subfamily)